MSASSVHESPWAMPDEYEAIPLSAGQVGAPMRVCVVVRREPDEVAGHLVVLRDTGDGRVLLGALSDAAGQVHGWLEIWVQDLERLASTSRAYRDAISNTVLDDRWRRTASAFAEADPGMLVATGWETEPPPPVFIDPDAGRPIHPEDEAGRPWMLCRDDQALLAHGLPPYGSSMHRYLHVPDADGEPRFVPVTEDAPTSDHTVAWDDAMASMRGLVALNRGGGLMLVRRHGAISYEDFVDVLGGKGWSGMLHGRSPMDLGASARNLERRDGAHLMGSDRLFLGQHGQFGRLVESFHLKLCTLADAVSSVREMVRRTERPVLSLAADRFQVRLGEPGVGLPTYWTARTMLADPGQAVALPVETSQTRYYLRDGQALSIYQPASAAGITSGYGTVRIRQVIDDRGDFTIVEGTLTTQERVAAARHDLVWLRLNVQDRRVDLYGRVESDSALASGEWRFRTVEHRFSPELRACLRQAEGVPIAETTFEIIPLLSTPCDLYALAVLAARTLLIDGETSLPVVVDELMSLARQVGHVHDGSSSVSLRVRGLFDEDSRFAQTLGPHRVTHEAISYEDALEVIPAELWWDTLALIVRMIPGIGPDSFAADLGDAPAGGIHKALDPVMEELERLIVRTRSLIVIDWKFNREIHAVVRRFATGTIGEPVRPV